MTTYLDSDGMTEEAKRVLEFLMDFAEKPSLGMFTSVPFAPLRGDTVNDLHKKGWVERSRLGLVRITDTGRAALAEAKASVP